MRHEMSIATIEGAVEEVADEMAGPERAISPPIGAEATQEAGGDGAHRASLARRRKEVEETLARNAADASWLARTTAVLGTEIVGGDVYARAGELTMLIMTGERPVSELVELLRWGHKRVQAARVLQAAVAAARCPKQAVLPGSVENAHCSFNTTQIKKPRQTTQYPLSTLWVYCHEASLTLPGVITY